MPTPEHLEVGEGVCRSRPRGEYTLIEIMELVTRAIAYCRDRGIGKLLVNATDVVGVSIPSLVDRFLMVEEWALAARGVVVVVLVVPPEYIHPEKFGMKVAADFGLIADVHTSETDALEWLSRQIDRA
jgi:hypothetical protein